MTTELNNLRKIQIQREQANVSYEYERYLKSLENQQGSTTLEDIVISDIMKGSFVEFHTYIEESFAKKDNANNGFKTFIKQACLNFWETALRTEDFSNVMVEYPRVKEGATEKLYWYLNFGDLNKYQFKFGPLAGQVAPAGSLLEYNPKSYKNPFNIRIATSKVARELDKTDLKTHTIFIPPLLNPIGYIHQILASVIFKRLVEEKSVHLIGIQSTAFDTLCANFNLIDYSDEDGVQDANTVSIITTLISLILEAKNNTRMFTRVVNNFDAVRFELSSDYRAEMKLKDDSIKVRFATYYPSVCPPVKHTSLVDGNGGYIIKKSPLIKRPLRVFKSEADLWENTYNIHYNGYQEEDVEKAVKRSEIASKRFSEEGKVLHPLIKKTTTETQNELFSNINRLQEIKYAVNQELLSHYPVIMEELVKVLGEEKFNRKFPAMNRTYEMALKHTEFDSLFYPLFFDSRDRFYPYCSNSLSFQSDDLGKGLVCFSNGRTLTKDGVDALYLALAEYLPVFDEEGNKINAAKKIESVKLKLMRKVVGKYLNKVNKGDFSFISEEGIDEPFVCVALLLDLVGYYKDKENHKSHTIVHLDSCGSGIQIMGLASGCVDTLRMTNVVNPPEGVEDIADVYLIIMKQIEDFVYYAANNGKTPNELNKSIPKYLKELFEDKSEYNAWLESELVRVSRILINFPEVFKNRKIIKTSAMCQINYDSKAASCFKNIIEELYDNHNDAFYALLANNKYRQFVTKLEDIFEKPTMDKLEDLSEEEMEEVLDAIEEDIDECINPAYSKASDIEIINTCYRELRFFCQICWDVMIDSCPVIKEIKAWIRKLIRFSCVANNSYSFINPMNGFPVALKKELKAKDLLTMKTKARNKCYKEANKSAAAITGNEDTVFETLKTELKESNIWLEKKQDYRKILSKLRKGLRSSNSRLKDIDYLKKKLYEDISYYRAEHKTLASGKVITRLKTAKLARPVMTGVCDVRKTVTSSLPSTIHSADGSIMLRLSRSFEDFAAIHDSAGVHANDIPRLKEEVGVTLKEFRDLNFFDKIAKQLGFTEKFPTPANPYNEEEHGKIENTLYAFG